MRDANEVISIFTDIKADPVKYLQSLKDVSGKKIIGCMPMYLPEEMIYASGMHPTYVPGRAERITLGSKHLQQFFCGYARAVVDAALKGDLDFLDGMLFQDTCHTLRPVFDIIAANHPYSFMRRINMPVVLSRPQAKPFFTQELRLLKRDLEGFAGKEISEKELKEAIYVYNENRELLKKIYTLRRSRPELIRAREMVSIVFASMIMPKTDHNLLLRKLLASISERTPPLKDQRIRVVLTGSLCEEPLDYLLDLIEELGGIVVDDDLFTGSRYFLNTVPLLTDPVESLVSAYINMGLPCPTRINGNRKLGKYVLDLARRSKADAIIIVMVKFCEAHDYAYPQMKQFFEEAKMPHLVLKTQHESTSIEQIKTRLQAFFELQRGR